MYVNLFEFHNSEIPFGLLKNELHASQCKSRFRGTGGYTYETSLTFQGYNFFLVLDKLKVVELAHSSHLYFTMQIQVSW